MMVDEMRDPEKIRPACGYVALSSKLLLNPR